MKPFAEAFLGIRGMRRGAEEGVRQVELWLKKLMYYFSWSSTCGRGQATMMHWIIQALIRWAGCTTRSAQIFLYTEEGVRNQVKQLRQLANLKKKPTSVQESEADMQARRSATRRERWEYTYKS
jgi:hypothetical protein